MIFEEKCRVGAGRESRGWLELGTLSPGRWNDQSMLDGRYVQAPQPDLYFMPSACIALFCVRLREQS